MDAQKFIDSIKLVVVNVTIDGINSAPRSPTWKKTCKRVNGIA